MFTGIVIFLYVDSIFQWVCWHVVPIVKIWVVCLPEQALDCRRIFPSPIQQERITARAVILLDLIELVM